MTKQNKKEALAIVEKLEQNVAGTHAADQDAGIPTKGLARKSAIKLLDYSVKRLSGVNPDKAIKQARDMKKKYPGLSDAEVVEKLIKAKCQKTAAIGVTTSAPSVIPGLGTAFALTVGLAVDISSILKMHSELVLEIAETYGKRLSEMERSEVLLAVTGLSAGINTISGKAVKGLSHKVGEIAAQKWLSKVIPAIGMATSASTNVLSTYIIGKRADAYFTRGPEAMKDLKDNLRALSGVDERKISEWLSESSHSVAQVSSNTTDAIVEGGRQGASRIVDVGRKAGRTMSIMAGKMLDKGSKLIQKPLSKQDSHNKLPDVPVDEESKE